MVVAQLVEQPPPIPQVRSLNLVIGKIYIEHIFTVNCIEKTTRGRNGQFFEKRKKTNRSYSR